MKVLSLINLFFLLLLTTGVWGQNSYDYNRRQEEEFLRREQEEIDRRARTAVPNPFRFVPGTRYETRIINTVRAFPGSIKLTESDKKLAAPEAELNAKYLEFLKQPKTGLLKLLEASCFEEQNTGRACAGNGLPAYGSAYSFRRNEYQMQEWADLWLNDDFFIADVLFGQGWLVALGDVEIENLSLQTKGADFLDSMTPKDTRALAETQYQQSVQGINENKLFYRKFVRVRENTAYVLRSVAYRGKFVRYDGNTTKTDMTKGDTRDDVIIAFRVIKKDSAGNVTIVWKELSRKVAPLIDLKK